MDNSENNKDTIDVFINNELNENSDQNTESTNDKINSSELESRSTPNSSILHDTLKEYILTMKVNLSDNMLALKLMS